MRAKPCLKFGEKPYWNKKKARQKSSSTIVGGTTPGADISSVFSMARAVIQLAVIATCVVLSLTAEDRQARSGDLDRGPPDYFFDQLRIDKNMQIFPIFRLPPVTNSTSSETVANLRFKIPLVDDAEKESRKVPEMSFEADDEVQPLRRRLEMSTEFFLIPSSSTPATTPSPAVIVKSAGDQNERIAGVFRNEVWVVPVLALSAITMLLIAGFEVFVLCKAWRTTPSRRHLFLGQMLLLGLFSCAGLASVYAASPTQFTCALMRFGTGVAYAIVFASLLVKCVFLISLNGGVYLPAPYQGLLLLFAILIQVAIGVQWLLTSPPLVDTVTVVHTNRNRLLVTAADISSTQAIPLCRTPYMDMLLSLIYVIFLIIFVTVLAVKSRGIRDNYREATYIGLSVGCSIPTWLIWTISGLIVSERHRDACIAFGIVIMSIMVFLIMFMPKGRQLAAMGKEGVYLEDREDRFSSLSRAGSGYSPSFFHFKPVKYGGGHGSKHQSVTTLRAGGGLYLRPDDGNLYTTLEPTLSSNPNVYFQRGNGLHPGMMY
ncbi:metabotropic glutamate receptor isoform X2 [Euwallacea fornicatus]|uniref:metabotropic glutamate receptor isoform X2 n=1 Tax=Euwallacea fornicatus TaxID=995702 RepID=UPI00338EA01F